LATSYWFTWIKKTTLFSICLSYDYEKSKRI